MASYPNGHFLENLPILNGKNSHGWSKQMKVVFCYHNFLLNFVKDVCDLVKNEVTPLSDCATNDKKMLIKN